MTTITPIKHLDQQTLSFRQMDALNGLPKGSSFRLFKHHREQLREGQDFYYLDGEQHQPLLARLKASEQIYQRTTHLVLFTRAGYARLQTLAG